MRKGMLFFSQYRTLRRIFLKNLKKYLRFVGPYRPGAFFLQDGVLRPTVWPLLCSDECGPGSGGIGSVAGAVMGAFIMSALDNGMSMMDVATFWQYIVKGAILLLAVWMDSATKRRA